jgi:hypothetical protein
VHDAELPFTLFDKVSAGPAFDFILAISHFVMPNVAVHPADPKDRVQRLVRPSCSIMAYLIIHRCD